MFAPNILFMTAQYKNRGFLSESRAVVLFLGFILTVPSEQAKRVYGVLNNPITSTRTLYKQNQPIRDCCVFDTTTAS